MTRIFKHTYVTLDLITLLRNKSEFSHFSKKGIRYILFE